MPTISTLGPPGKKTIFTYSGDIETGVTLEFSGNPRVSSEFFVAILDEFQGKIIPGGFSMTDPTPGGLGEWVQNNSCLPKIDKKGRTGTSLTPLLAEIGYFAAGAFSGCTPCSFIFCRYFSGSFLNSSSQPLQQK